ncbi:MAG: bifunctional phosphoribosyl-AMP cyclohydrolase/phosphoribosyl-ATP diphosphatase HisIE [Eubacterium sp.]|nr:bifunctional phosphoribosyl-AMP cyclohydrolase/phosphoribosyl-ATP diphosphatase HisIE [Eubacterium sp.]
MARSFYTLDNKEATFDDVKHILYSGEKYIVFSLDGEDEASKFAKLYKYSKERFPNKVFASADELPEEIPFSAFKLNGDGLIPVIAQDYKTNEVLMMAYMNEESYNKTLETGLMTYWSRSRQKLWTKGEESGHIQKMVSLTIDCDKDTILAKVDQTGPACHTGNPTCFFTPLEDAGVVENSSFKVFQDVYNVIADRKVNPREGSYTNYLFDKGIDKILKKVGEECTEIVIAAKNPDASEIKYEIADFLYHAMVLMVEKGVTWDEINDELARRE